MGLAFFCWDLVEASLPATGYDARELGGDQVHNMYQTATVDLIDTARADKGLNAELI